jgi:hypothetical protein
MPSIFQYKSIRGRLAPLITIGIRLEGLWYPIEVYVDSGAVYTLLRAQIADGIGFEYRSGEQIYFQVGDGSFIPAYLHDLELQIGTEQFSTKIGFSDKLGIGFNLLGRAGVFERFKICFQENRHIMTFE